MIRKLIRDKMRYTMGLQKGESIDLCGPVEYVDLLHKKFEEEVKEFKAEWKVSSAGTDSMLREAADVLEVIESIVFAHTSATLDDILKMKKYLRDRKGGFEAGVVVTMHPERQGRR